MGSRFPYQLALALDRELEELDRHMHRRSIPEGLTAERARMMLERAREKGREAQDQMSRGQSLQHGSGLAQAMAHGKHPAMAFEEGRRMSQDASVVEFHNRIRLRYLQESVIPRLHEKEKAAVDAAAGAAEKG